MAVIRCAVVPFKSPPPLLPQHSVGRRFSLKFLRCSSASPPFPSRSSKRKNYLRPKILRTLKPKPSETTLIPVETQEIVPPDDAFSDQIDCVEKLQVSGSSVVAEGHSDIIGKLYPKSVAKYGLHLLGVFAFQTVCAVWFLGNSANSPKPPEISNDHGSGTGTIDTGSLSKRRILLNENDKRFNEKNGFKASNVIYLDELEMNQKIEEIRAMAREARKSEHKGGENEYDEDEISDGTSSLSGRFDIEKEIGARLANTEKRLNSQRKGFGGLRVKPLDEFENDDGDKRGDLDMEDNNKSLMFEKKYKFKAEKPPSNVKGFPGREDSRGNNKSVSGTVKTEKEKHKLNGYVNHLLNGGKQSKEMQKEAGTADSEMISAQVLKQVHNSSKFCSGITLGYIDGCFNSERTDDNMRMLKEIDQGRSSNGVKKSRNSGYSGERDLNLVVENSEAASESRSISLSSHTDNSRHGGVKIRKPTRKVADKQSDAGNALWWLKLPYVLRILMRSNIDQETSEGFFTLRTNSVEPNSDESSYAVAFEDQNDARNFCYLLESLFEELGGFSANVVPTSTKDLHKEVSSGSKNVIVVKKRQLKLYAGQPFEDVERALHSLIQER